MLKREELYCGVDAAEELCRLQDVEVLQAERLQTAIQERIDKMQQFAEQGQLSDADQKKLEWLLEQKAQYGPAGSVRRAPAQAASNSIGIVPPLVGSSAVHSGAPGNESDAVDMPGGEISEADD